VKNVMESVRETGTPRMRRYRWHNTWYTSTKILHSRIDCAFQSRLHY